MSGLEQAEASTDPIDKKSVKDAQSSFSVAALSLALLVVVILQLTALAPLAFMPTDKASSLETEGASSASTISQFTGSQRGQSSQRVWDWQAMSDDSGYVDVILLLPSGETSGDVSGSLLTKISQQKTKATRESKDQYLESLMDQIKAGKKREFINAVQGVSLSATVESLETLQEYCPSIRVYPDNCVQAYVTASIAQVGAEPVWSRTDGSGQSVTGVGIVVAVIDTGVDYTHPDLGGALGPSYKVIGGYDFVNGDSDPMDDNGHGTHVAGIIGGNGATFKGVAPDVKILAYKALGADGYGQTSAVVAAIERAMDPNGDGDKSDHADVISMSLGNGADEDDPLTIASEEAIRQGIVVVAAAGNDGPAFGSVGSPGIAPNVITVGAVDGSGKLASFSSRGTGSSLRLKPEICAPGVYVNSTVPYSGVTYSSSSGYKLLSGTSMAAPHVSGAAALLLQLHPNWSPEQVKSAVIAGVNSSGESVWHAGAGNLWIPRSADADLLVSVPLISYVIAGSPAISINLTNFGASAALSCLTQDYYSLATNGSSTAHIWVNLSSAALSPTSVSSGGSAVLTFSVGIPPPSVPEGYFEGELRIYEGSRSLRVTFGYVTLSRLNVHVIDTLGREVVDQYGRAGVYRLPDGDLASILYSNSRPCPPASFLLPEGDYAVHCAGHGLLYRYKDPYLLSKEITLHRLESLDVYLNMSDARRLKLDLKTDSDVPIYAKDLRMFVKRSGLNDFSIDVTGYDALMGAEDLLYLPTSKYLYVSNTSAEVGISIIGYSYNPALWDFFTRNWLNWYQFSAATRTRFYIESTADLQYFLAWEFQSISASTPDTLAITPGLVSKYETKYDIPGALSSSTGSWGVSSSPSGLATLYTRRDTDCPIFPFYSGMTRTTIVQGVFSEMYLPSDLYDGAVEREFYSTDYSHSDLVMVDEGIYLPDRNYVTEIQGVMQTDRVGMGPFYPSVWTENTDTSMVLFQPLLRDQSGARVTEPRYPRMSVYRDGSLISSEELVEYMIQPDAYRVVDLTAGFHEVVISAVATPQICNDVVIRLGFRVPGVDVDPPEMTALEMSQRFVPGQSVSVVLAAVDDGSIGNVEIGWRSTNQGSWNPLPVNALGGGRYGAVIQTSTSNSAIHLRAKVSDVSGNYLEYTSANVSLAQRPVSFSLASNRNEVQYGNYDCSLLLTGFLLDSKNAPLSSGYAVPLELMVGGTKVAMILDEYLVNGNHVRNGTITYDWHFNPAFIFTGPNQLVNITVSFDMGIYAPANITIPLRSVGSSNTPPTIVLQSPANNSLFASGQVIDLDITDDGTVTAKAYLDGTQIFPFTSPWQLSTSSWADGNHVLSVVATDDELATARSSYSFEVDALSPSVVIVYPTEDARVPMNSVLIATVSDARLSDVAYSIDGKPNVQMSPPYNLDLSGLGTGPHSVAIMAADTVGHSTTKSVSFVITASSVALQLLSPSNNSVIRSGILIQFLASGGGSMTYKWSEAGIWHNLGSQTVISTSGWQQGLHTILVNASSSLGGWDQISVALIIDDIRPIIQLQSPANGSFVSSSDRVTVHIQDANPMTITWTLWGVTHNSSLTDLSIPLAYGPADGTFSILFMAVDKAGNQATEEFVFDLDSAPPQMSVANLISGEVAKLGTILEVMVTDPYLTTVEWVLDDGQSTVLTDPYDIDTSSFSVGWHSLRITANDASGKLTVVAFSFYLDDASPTIESLPDTVFTEGEDFSVSAAIADDYGVGQALLYYELKDGSYASAAMTYDGGLYVAVLPADVLWDGMDVFVSCQDIAGNSAIGEHVELTATTTKSGLNLGFLGSMSGIAIMCAAAMITSISMLYVSRRKNKDDDEQTEMQVPEESPKPKSRPEHIPNPSPVPRALPPTRSNVHVRTARTERRLAEPKPARDPLDELEEIFREEPPRLIDSIPEIVLRSEGQKGSDAPATDFGDLIERELLIPGLKNSVFKEDVRDLETEIEIQLEELRAMIKDKPKRPTE